MPDTLTPPPPKTRAEDRETPPGAAHGLPDGARMRRAEYHRLYERTPPGFRAELVGGVVRVRKQEPVTISEPHATFQKWASAWLWEYEKRTPGVESLCPVTLELDDGAEPEPDALLRRRPPAGPPELIAEVAVSSLGDDLGAKFDDYEAAGVAEYVVFDVRGRRVRWFARGDAGSYTELAPDPADGLLKSGVFPGLWLDPAAFYDEDAAGVERAVAAGVAARAV